MRRFGKRASMDMVRERQEKIGAFREREQHARTDFAIIGMLPARERLHTRDPIIRHRILRLEQDLDLAIVERMAQIILQPVIIDDPARVSRHLDANAALRTAAPGIGEHRTGTPQ